MTYYKVGYYKPTFEFTRITEFMAVLAENGRLVGITGPSTSRQAALDARLFAKAPDLLFALKKLHLLLEPLDPNQPAQTGAESFPEASVNMTELIEALRYAGQIIDSVGNGNGNGVSPPSTPD